MVDGSIHGAFTLGGIANLSYINVSTRMCAITYVSGKGPTYGTKFWYQLLSKIVNMVMV